MKNILYFAAVVLVVFWAIGYLVYGASSLIHILLVIALIAVLFKIIKG